MENKNPKVYLISETSSVFCERGRVKDEFALILEACPVCGGKKFKSLFRHDGFNYFRCRKCTFVFTNPRLNEKGSLAWYNSDYYNTALGREIFINQQKERYYSVSLNNLHFNKVIEIIENNFISKNISIIDTGCATGSLLAYLRDICGFQNLTGIDLNSKAVDFAKTTRKLNVKVADITDIKDNNYYDLVINTENIEHVNDLEKYIRNLKAIVKTNGFVLISTPHNDLRALKRYGLFADYFCAPNHINYFNKNTLELFLTKNGFKPESIFIDKAWGFNLLSFIKSKLYTIDQVTTDAPFEAYFSAPIRKNNPDRRALVKVRKLDLNPAPQVSPKRNIKSTLKSILSIPIGKLYSTHMILLAKKIY